jgi:hypothetical protein
VTRCFLSEGKGFIEMKRGSEKRRGREREREREQDRKEVKWGFRWLPVHSLAFLLIAKYREKVEQG